MDQTVPAFAKPKLSDEGTRALYLRGYSHLKEDVTEVLMKYPLLKGLVTSASGVCVCVTGDPACAAAYIVEHLTPFTVIRSGDVPEEMPIDTTTSSGRDFTIEKLPQAHEEFRQSRLAFYARNHARLGTLPWTKPGLTCEGASLLWGNLDVTGGLQTSVKDRLLGCPHIGGLVGPVIGNDYVTLEVTGSENEAALYVVDYVTPFRIVSLPPDEPLFRVTPD